MKVKFIGGSKSSFAKLAIGTALLLVGFLIGVFTVFAFAVRSQPSPEELEAILLQDSIKYIAAEQERLQTDCNELNTIIRVFIEQDVRPMLSSYQPGGDWYKDIDPDMRKRMEKLRYDYSSCGRLYSEAQRIKWEGLKKFGYTTALETELTVLNTLIGFEFCDVHDVKCMDQGFFDLKDAVSKIETRLVASDAQTQMGPN